MRPAPTLLAFALLAGAAAARAGSEFTLPAPEAFGVVEGDTFDAAGHRVGTARMSSARRPDGRIELGVYSGIDGSSHNDSWALLEQGADGALRVVFERSESFDEGGASLGQLRIDHAAHEAHCDGPDGAAPGVRIPLAEPDRVVNVPLQLLFQRLVRGDAQKISFQVLLCRFGVRLVDARAQLAAAAETAGDLVEVRTELDLGPLLSRLAAPFLPTLSFWFERAAPGRWMGHRMPLYSKGPTVWVMREGLTPERLTPSVAAAH